MLRSRRALRFTRRNRRLFCRPSAQPVIASISRGVVAYRDRHRAARIARIFLLYRLMTHTVKMMDGSFIHVAQLGIERKPDFVPDLDIARGTAAIIEVAAFEVAEHADVMNGSIGAGDLERRLASRRKKRALCEKRVEHDRTALIGFAPDSEVSREMIAQDISGLGIGLDREPDGGRGSRVGRTLHTPAELLAQHAPDERQLDR